ncbi:MAG: hypothetical protein REI64_03685 [Pedobacter sp.]|uniref:DUF6702 family protein n=1 Tax=Pedobacter sp. TaxID=1411316 RepID=UPI00280890A1|nr:DUF6702 family protein [Pedobacter sp.]MDQ8003876.1 hypothetical protein [Pedobacter sp.]
MLLPLSFLPLEENKKHPFHVSTTEISHNAKDKTLEITCRIFTDDFENVLSQRFKSKIDLHAKNREKEMNGFIKNYIETNLKIAIDGKMVKPNFLGFENDHEATNVYLEVEKLSSFKTLVANNGILYDLFDDQMNILHVEKNGARKSTKASFPEKKMSVAF